MPVTFITVIKLLSKFFSFAWTVSCSEAKQSGDLLSWGRAGGTMQNSFIQHHYQWALTTKTRVIAVSAHHSTFHPYTQDVLALRCFGLQKKAPAFILMIILSKLQQTIMQKPSLGPSFKLAQTFSMPVMACTSFCICFAHPEYMPHPANKPTLLQHPTF